MASRAIKIKHLKIKSANELPSDACETPGGTMFAFTPGGTKIVYDREYLMALKRSPASMVSFQPTRPNFGDIGNKSVSTSVGLW